MPPKDKEFLESIILDLELLVVSLDRLGGEPDKIVEFLRTRGILDRLAIQRRTALELAKGAFDRAELKQLKVKLADLPFWTSRDH